MEPELGAQEEPLLEKDSEHGAARTRPTPRIFTAWTWIVQSCLFLSSACMLILARWDPASASCSAALSNYSPALTAVPDDSYEWQRFHGTVMENSTYKGEPTEERRAAWEELARPRYFRIDEHTLHRIDAPAGAVQLPGDDGGYLATLETYHQIHCLKELWLNTYEGFANPETDPSIYRQHLDHCADILRQKLLCDADVTPITLNWVKHVRHATPNFNVLHRCRPTANVNEWMQQHEIVDDGVEEILYNKPADALELESFP